MKEEYFIKKQVSFNGSIAFTKSAVKNGVTNRTIRLVAMMTLIQVFALQPANMQWHALFQGFGCKIEDLGTITFLVYMTLAVAATVATRVLKKMRNDEKYFLAVCQALMGAGVVFAVVADLFPVAISAYLIHEFARGLFAPIKDDFINQSISSGSKERATLLSIDSLAHHIGGAIGLFVSGYIAREFGLQLTWIAFGGFLAIASLLIFRNGKK